MYIPLLLVVNYIVSTRTHYSLRRSRFQPLNWGSQKLEKTLRSQSWSWVSNELSVPRHIWLFFLRNGAIFLRGGERSINNNSSFWNVYILGQPGENRVTLIFFLGGVTFAEIAALRFLSQLEDGGTEYVIATTKLINGASWIESLMEKPF